MLTQELLQDVIQRLVKTFDPVEIYLFGSYAWGKPHEDSNINLLVLLDKSVFNPWEEQKAAHHALFNLDIPKDIRVRSKVDFDRQAQDVESFSHRIKEKGVRLYAKQENIQITLTYQYEQKPTIPHFEIQDLTKTP